MDLPQGMPRGVPQGMPPQPMLQMDMMTPFIIEVIAALFKETCQSRDKQIMMLDNIVMKLIKGLRQSTESARHNPALAHMVIDGTLSRMAEAGEHIVLELVNNLIKDKDYTYTSDDIARLGLSQPRDSSANSVIAVD